MASHIHRGFWINWSKGPIGGATLTFGEREAGLLTAFIATFITIVGAELWRIICYVSHQIRCKETPQDGLYHQTQVALRNSATPGGTAWLFLQQMFYWPGKARLAILRTLPWALFGTAYIALFGVLAVFSSDISKNQGTERLLVSDNCGLWMINETSPDATKAFQVKTTNDSLTAAAYARSCYGGTYDLSCGTYPKPCLNYTTITNASCPFHGLCKTGDNGAFTMQSVLLDTHHDLGINAPTRNRLQVQKSTTCAPLVTEGYEVKTNGTGPMTKGDVILRYNYGYLSDGTGPYYNYTYEYNTVTSVVGVGYMVDAIARGAGMPEALGAYVFIPEIAQDDADLSMLYISANGITYQQPEDDPVFAAHFEGPSIAAPYWIADQWVAPVACAEQYRICNPNNNKCTRFQGAIQLMQSLVHKEEDLLLNTFQNQTATRLALNFQVTSVYHATYTRGQNALKAQESVTLNSQAPLAKNQWHIEASGWFDAGLARLQQQVQEYSTGPSKLTSGSYLWQPQTENNLVAELMCYSQFINDASDTVSFSIVGMAILFGIGGIIILTALCIDTVVGWLQLKYGKGLHARMQWLLDDTLQLQRLLFSEMKLGTWADGYDKVPVTEGGNQSFVGPADRHIADVVTGMHVHHDGSEQNLYQSTVEAKHDAYTRVPS